MTELSIESNAQGPVPNGLQSHGSASASKHSSRSSSETPFSMRISNSRRFPSRASIVLIGIRGAGKRSLGFIAAAHLSRRFITEGHYFQEVTGLSKTEYLSRNGKAEYYRCCRDVFRRMLYQNEWNCVIECGMASLDKEAQQLLLRLSKSHPVIYIHRDFDQISSILMVSALEKRRLLQWDITHRQFSNLEFHNLFDITGTGNVKLMAHDASTAPLLMLRYVKLEFTRFIDFVLGRDTSRPSSQSPFALDAIPLERRPHTYAVAMSLSQITGGGINLENIEMGEDAIRLRIDVRNIHAVDEINHCIALIRRKLGVPIILDVDAAFLRLNGQGSHTYMGLLEHGLRIGVDFIIVDVDCGIDNVSHILVQRGYTKIIGRYFDQAHGSGQWLSDERMAKARYMQSLGFDIIEICQKAYSKIDNDDITVFKSRVVHSLGIHIPVICYNTGIQGRSSLVFNSVLTPVRPAFLPEQQSDENIPLVTAAEATAALFGSFTLDSLHYFVIGNLSVHSLSPAMHNAAYKHLGMRHDYSTHEASQFEQLLVFLEDFNFGGCSINTPYKVSVFEHLTHRSQHAEAIGAVNTLLPLRKSADGEVLNLVDQASQRNRAGPVAGFYGDNTDWIGFVESLRHRLAPRNAISPHSTGLILGAGGAARAGVYAMIHIGCQNIFICDRTTDAATTVANHFNVWMRANAGATKDYVHVIPSLQTPWPSDYQHPTMLLSCIPGTVAGDQNPTGFRIREDWLASPSGGVVADVSYNPVDTPLLKQAQEKRMETNRPWIVVNGLEMLPEQAVAQFELMTGRRAPRKLMREVCLNSYGKT